MSDKCLDCPAPSADMDGFIVSGPGGAPRSEGSGVSSPEGPFVREAPQTGHVVIMGTLGAEGSPGSLPDAPQVGWAYVAEDAGTYGDVQATEGDLVYCMSLNPTRWGVLQADSDDSGRDLVSVSASLRCTSSYVATNSSSMLIGTDMMYYADDEFPSNFCDPSTSMIASLANGSFEIRGTDYNRMVAACSTASTFAFILDSGAFGRITADVFADFFNGSIVPDGYIDSMNGKLRFVLDSRRELTSQDPGGPDIVVSLSVYEDYPALTLTSAKASGAESTQTVDMSCLVPPVFNGLADGLVPVNSPATQTSDLLSDDGTWMRPATDAEIDAIFA